MRSTSGGDAASDDTPGPLPRQGVRLGVDVGSVRVGVARSDPHGILATPVVTLARDETGGSDLDSLRDLVAELEVVEVVVGLPRTLRGAIGSAATSTRSYGALLSARIAPVPVVFVDERLTSVTANRMLAEQGIREKSRRAVIDQAAAVAILQVRLDTLSADRRQADRRQADRRQADRGRG
ncbi:Holliday junction resolvase RuvX [Nakamurella sp. PAMC28650]|uniref:Holliday junction resolvase RuvX n=1 Tax=Nakamurella sp. PAMC28650 TaxID=2762325 RepID=UPI00164DB8E1|nr:Holliday junction resolvase RuvX [Nakamurella sp. PAMC28650]QNK79580.1 Holliday junction resolvase RuvX [Nakamurella sp. PAMC28650]